MNKTEARALMMKYLIPLIEKYGFKERGRGTEFQITRKTKNGEDIINGGFTDYNPVQQIIYNLYKRDGNILSILKNLEATGEVLLSPPVSKHTGTLGISYEASHKMNKIGYLPLMETEADVEKCVGMMLEFLEGTAFPLLDKFEDLREMDKMINGDEPWETDWDKPFVIGAHFFENRLIIAKLSGNPNYENLVDFNYKTIDKLSSENGPAFTYDRKDMSKPLPALIRLLERVSPLY